MISKSHSLHVVEPTLADHAGHCFSLTKSLVLAWKRQFPQSTITVWAGQMLRDRTQVGDGFPVGVQIREYFLRAVRRFQLPWLYWRLVRQHGVVFVSTARVLDLMILSWVMPKPKLATKTQATVCVYFHWLRKTETKAQFLARFAVNYPEVLVFATTPTLAQTMTQTGLPTLYLPYPHTDLHINSGSDKFSSVTSGNTPVPFKHLLYAGAARLDKGFDHIVPLVAHLLRNSFSHVIRIQVTGEKSAMPESSVMPYIYELRSLAGVSNGRLQLITQTPAESQYRQQFAGAVVLQLYRPDEFADRVSGITLDAIAYGAPIIAIAGTWSAQLIERFGCGVVIPFTDMPFAVERIEAAIQDCISHWPILHGAALRASQQLRLEMNWTPFFEALAKHGHVAEKI